MSQYADTCSVLPKMLNKYPKEYHTAIVETFAETMGDDWSDKDARDFFMSGKGISIEADRQIKVEAGCWGMDV